MWPAQEDGGPQLGSDMRLAACCRPPAARWPASSRTWQLQLSRWQLWRQTWQLWHKKVGSRCTSSTWPPAATCRICFRLACALGTTQARHHASHIPFMPPPSRPLQVSRASRQAGEVRASVARHAGELGELRQEVAEQGGQVGGISGQEGWLLGGQRVRQLCRGVCNSGTGSSSMSRGA